MPFKFNFTEEQLGQIIGKNANLSDWYKALSDMLPEYDIDTPERVACFLGQCAHETGNFTLLKENLNYSADSLQKVFKKYFPTADLANQYARKPEKIGSRVYADRMGNGNEASGEGFKYRGRGLIQVTGKENYSTFAKSINMPLEEVTEYLETFEGAVEGACWFWDKNNINPWADKLDHTKITKIINGGTNGLDDRIAKSNSALSVLSKSSTPKTYPVLKKGSSGNLVKELQLALEIEADGEFGPGTERAVKNWQAKNGLVADGIAGQKTLQLLLG